MKYRKPATALTVLLGIGAAATQHVAMPPVTLNPVVAAIESNTRGSVAALLTNAHTDVLAKGVSGPSARALDGLAPASSLQNARLE